MGDPPSLPQLTFEGVRGSTAYLDIALDAISIRRGSCSRGEPLSLLLFPPRLYICPGGRSSSGTETMVSSRAGATCFPLPPHPTPLTPEAATSKETFFWNPELW